MEAKKKTMRTQNMESSRSAEIKKHDFIAEDL
jgi:hypothetical protein